MKRLILWVTIGISMLIASIIPSILGVAAALPVPKPKLTVSVTPNPVFPGQLVTVRWAAINVDTCYVATTTTERKPVPTFGTQTFTAPSKSMNVLVLCVGEFSSVSKSVPVTIVQPKPVVNLSVTPTTITPGQSITVTWSSTSATGCYWGTGASSPYYQPSIGQSGTQIIPTNQYPYGPPLKDFVVSVTCIWFGGSDTKSVPVSVTYPKPELYMTSALLVISPYWSARVDWFSKYATECYYWESKIPWPRTPTFSGSEVIYWWSSLQNPPRFSIYCEWPGGSISKTIQFSYPAPQPFTTLVANPNNIKLGQSTMLNWFSTYTNSCTLDSGNGPTPVTLSGSMSQVPTKSTTYLLSCTGSWGISTFQAPVTVTP